MNAPAPRALVILGSNIEPETHLLAALRALSAEFGIESASAVYVSPAVGAPGTPEFQNQAVLLRSECTPDELRARFRSIEKDLGRVRGDDRNAPRTIDIDLVARFDEEGVALPSPAVDPDLPRHHHLAHPAAELLPLARLEPGGPALTDLARALGRTPDGFRRIPAHCA